MIATAATLAAGRWSDRLVRRRAFLMGSAGLMLAGLLLLAARRGRGAAFAGNALYMSGLNVFLAIDVVPVAQILPDPRHRGRALGLMNGANTLPAIVAPVLAWATLDGTAAGYRMMYLVLAGAQVVALLVLACNKRLC